MNQRKFRFVGTEAEVGEVRLDHLGQEVTLNDQAAQQIVFRPRGVALLPESDFDAIGFTDQELAAYANPGDRVNLSDETAAKFRAAAEKVAAQQASYQAPTDQVVPDELKALEMGKRLAKNLEVK